MALVQYVNKLLNYRLQLKRTDANLDTPNKMATTNNLNWEELEKYINNLRALLIEIAETIDVEGLVETVLSALVKKKYHLLIEHDLPDAFRSKFKLLGRTIEINEIEREGMPNAYEILGFEETECLLIQTRFVYDDPVTPGTQYEMMAALPIRLEPKKIIIEPYEKIDRDIHVIII